MPGTNFGPMAEFIVSGLKLALAVAACVVLAMYLLQERMIFFPQPLAPGRAVALAQRAPLIEALEVRAYDGTRLQGWLARPRGGGRFPLIIYFGGNAEEVSSTLDDPSRPAHWGWAALNYRGYGGSGGSPGEAALIADALAIHDLLAARADVDASRIVAFGRSLGSGVAVQLAAQRRLAGVVLVTPYDSLINVASHHYPLLPVRWLLRHRFDSGAHAPSLDVPLLALAAQHDGIVPPRHAQALVQAWKGASRYVVLEQADHNTIALHPRYRTEIDAFLKSIGAVRDAARASPA